MSAPAIASNRELEAYKGMMRVLGQFKGDIENKITESIDRLGPSTPLRDACAYALTNGGKRFRPALVFMVAKALGHGLPVGEAALCVEFLHTASLIADDLPCMDNDDERRNKPSTHKVYGETVALLATYALIASGYECLQRNAQVMKQAGKPFSERSDKACVLALENVTRNTGLLGATGGQFLDIFPPDSTVETLRRAIELKTVALFEIAIVLGWLYGGGDLERLDKVKKVAEHLGMAFQIVDDFNDMAQDKKNERAVNFANALGVDRAMKIFSEEMCSLRKTLQETNLDSEDFLSIANSLEAAASYQYSLITGA